MSQSLLYDEIKLVKNVSYEVIQDILDTLDGSDVDQFIEFDLSYPDNKKEKTKSLPFSLENNFPPAEKFSDYMNEMKPNIYTPNKKLLCH